MDKLGQICQTTKEYWKSYLVTPCLFAVISIVIRCQTEGWVGAVNEAISWAEWVLIPALIGFLVVFLWHYFRDPYIKVQAEVKDIKTYDYYARSEGEDANEGDKEITVGVTLFPSKPVKVSDILFRLSGKYFSAKEFSLTAGRIVSFSTRVIENKESYMLSFHIPKEFAVNSDNARIIAIALNIKRYSKPIPIKFGDNRQ